MANYNQLGNGEERRQIGRREADRILGEMAVASDSRERHPLRGELFKAITNRPIEDERRIHPDRRMHAELLEGAVSPPSFPPVLN